MGGGGGGGHSVLDIEVLLSVEVKPSEKTDILGYPALFYHDRDTENCSYCS